MTTQELRLKNWAKACGMRDDVDPFVMLKEIVNEADAWLGGPGRVPKFRLKLIGACCGILMLSKEETKEIARFAYDAIMIRNAKEVGIDVDAVKRGERA